MKPKRTREVAHAAATDAGNRAMRAGGRAKWNAADYDAACVEFDRLWPVERELAEGLSGERSEFGRSGDPR